MTDAASQAPPPIDIDSPCMHCGYNLRGLLSDGRCPECGQAISASLRGDLLRNCDPLWLGQLRLGASLKLWAIVVWLVFGFAAGFMVAFGFPLMLVQFVMLAGSALGLWGTWCITSQEPRIALDEEPLTLRKFIRASAIAGALGSLLLLAQTASPLPGVVLVVGTILSYAGFAASYGELFYFRRFANRAPDPDLVKSTRRMIIVAPIYGGILVVVGIAIRLLTGIPVPGTKPGAGGVGTTAAGAAAPAVPAAPGAGFGAMAGVGVCGAGLFGLILLLWYVRLLTKYKAKFTEAIAQASAASPSSTSDQPDPDQPLPS